MNSAETFLKLEQGRYETGIDPYVDVLIAQTTLLSNQQTLNNLQVQEMTAAVALIEASVRRMGSFAIAESAAGDGEASQRGHDHPAIVFGIYCEKLREKRSRLNTNFCHPEQSEGSRFLPAPE